MIDLNIVAEGDLLPAFRGSVVRTSIGIGPNLGAPVFLTVEDWDTGRHKTFMLTQDQFEKVEFWS